MKSLKLYCCIAILGFTTISIQAQTVDDIINTYIENIGGYEAWSEVNTMVVTGEAMQQGMGYPFVATYTIDGRTHINIDLQGQKFTIEAFDGETEWAMNFQTQKAEAADSESSLNYKIGTKDNITDPFFGYKKKGYTAELLGKEEFEGTPCFKVKLTKTPEIIEGKEVENVETYYFDTDTYVPIAMESVINSGPSKGTVSQTIFSDYQEVDGKYMAYAIIFKYNGQTAREVNMKTVDFNVNIDDSIFEMPKEETSVKN